VAIPAPEWFPRRRRFLRFDIFLFGTAMVPSSLGRGGGALARPAIQIGPAMRAEPATIFPAEGKVIHCQRQLLPNRRPDIHPRGLLRQRIDAGIVLELRVWGEHHLHGLHHRHDELRQAPPAHRSDLALEPPMPEEPVLTGPFESSADGQRALERHFESLEERISGRELPTGLDRTVAELADVNL